MSCVNMFKNKRISSVDGDKDKEQFHKFLTNYVPVNRFDFINFDFKVTRLNDFLKIYTIIGGKYPDISLHFHLYSQSWVELCLHINVNEDYLKNNLHSSILEALHVLQ